MAEYFVTIVYATPAGWDRRWAAVVEADSLDAAHAAAKARLHRTGRRVGRIFSCRAVA